MLLLSCGYRNASDRMVILRCLGPSQYFLERVVFPFELLTFECPEGSEVEIWTHGLGGPDLRETIVAADLSLDAPPLELLSDQQRHEPASTLAWLEVEAG